MKAWAIKFKLLLWQLVLIHNTKSVPEFGKTTTTSRPASTTTTTNSGIPDIPVFMKR